MLHTLVKLTTRSAKRPGRGIGSGKGGHTAGRGAKGHLSRQGGKTPLWFEGGQLPLIKRLPYIRGKAHFDPVSPKALAINVARLSKMNGQDVTPETLVANGFIKNAHTTVKLVGSAELENIGEVRGVQLTQAAKASIEKAGGRMNE